MFVLNVIASNNFCPADTQQITIYVNSPIGLNDLTYKDLIVYPIPTSGMLNIEFADNTNSFIPFKLQDITGKIIYTSIITNPKSLIDLKHLPDGLYFITLGENYRIKIIIQK